ncbi:unnamed protein product [Urochloa decumbens]|uniref:protein disulfide-isomerase n=1 Tax=Urochloa decumbens TaxID=240449 RepID=A0ABC9B8J5_9POAL
MGSMVRHLGNTTSSITSMHHLSDLWKGPRGTVLRIQALTVVAIITTFFLVAFGSCRRWSNRWIVQKGFFAAQVLSLSLGTYSIGIMQSSSVKSEMYPIWTVSLFTLFGCIDPVTNYNGLDYKGPLSKVVYGICLHCGYVLLMSISAISSVVGNITIGVLSGITFIKGFHRSMAFVQQSRMQNLVEAVINFSEGTCVLRYDYHSTYNNSRRCEIVDFPTDGNFPSVIDSIKYTDAVSLAHVDFLLSKEDGILLWPCYDACVAYCLSHSLQRHFLGLSSRKVDPETLEGIDYRWALKVIEIELAFLHDIFFTGSAFLHYYQAKTASLWVFVSFIGICCVGVAAAIPGTMSSPRTASGPGGCTNVVGTTTSDLVITFCILASLALLQLMQLIRCWTSNWARLAVVCAYSREQRKRSLNSWSWSRYETPYWRTWWMRLKVFVATSTNWFDKYLWQDKIGQYSIVMLSEVGSSRREGIVLPRRRFTGLLRCVRLVKVLGLDYVWEVIWDLLGSDPNKRGAVRLDDDVKASIIDFLGNKINSDRLDGNWLSFHDDPHIEVFLPYSRAPEFQRSSQGQRYTRCVMTWYVVTWYCELEEQERERMQNGSSTAEEGRGCTGTSASYLKQAAQVVAGCFKKAAAAGGEENQNSYRRVANALSKYCAYLVVSVPELLPGLSVDTRREYDSFVKAARQAWNKDRLLKAMLNSQFNTAWDNINAFGREDPLLGGAPLVALMRRPDRWKALVDVWVRMLVYAAPYGNAEAHMQQLSRGGEFITHLWALLYHLGIREWKLLGNVLDVVTIDQAQRILTESFRDDKNEYILTQDNHAIVVAFLRSHSDSYSDELAAASELEKHVSFYGTTSPEIAKLFHIDPAANLPSLVLLKKEEEKLTLYDGEFKRYAIADFVSANKLPLVTTFTQKTVSSLDCYPIRKLACHIAHD